MTASRNNTSLFTPPYSLHKYTGKILLGQEALTRFKGYDCWEGNQPIPVHHPDNLNRHRRVGRDQTTGIIGHQGSDVSRVTGDTRIRPVNRLDWEADRPE
ncbi:hypothetical protein TNIN_209311 [Trichonephila inaurata madagascariensis]|uniref:Uncharacterized protein n=1 Tax=Trichonephila inaurata madagascariensis TaxID=2747483 RepID=A0A8X7BZV7_9ARAC|nr:hypothetical protein TNIN_209311 [Trichonephila inaurata madagascariensis]